MNVHEMMIKIMLPALKKMNQHQKVVGPWLKMTEPTLNFVGPDCNLIEPTSILIEPTLNLKGRGEMVEPKLKTDGPFVLFDGPPSYTLNKIRPWQISRNQLQKWLIQHKMWLDQR
jgi:hypothetical protein